MILARARTVTKGARKHGKVNNGRFDFLLTLIFRLLYRQFVGIITGTTGEL
jgi:hypothetical protein